MSARDVILVSHPVHVDISEDEMRGALPTSDVVRGVVEVKPARLSFDETRNTDWIALAREQAARWRASVVPLLEKYPAASVVYFGVAPIPLAVHLGSLLERLRKATAYLRHHLTKEWHFAGSQQVSITGPAGPTELTRSTEPAIISISTTAPADVDALRSVAGASSADLDVRTVPLGEDILDDGLMHQVAARFHDCLGLLETNRPNVTEAHLAAVVPTGLAFLMGAQLTSTRHVRVVTYQYHRSLDPRLVEALRLPIREQPRRKPNDEEVAIAARLRVDWEAQRQQLVARFPTASGGAWWNVLGDIGQALEAGAFGLLQQPVETPLAKPIDVAVTDVATDFRFDPDGARWLFGDGLLASIERGLPPEELSRAGRMLLLHESLHHGSQGLTEAKAQQIRFAPKVLEDLDYLADTWTILHEFAFSGLLDVDGFEAQRQGLLRIVETAVATMWAFDADRELGVLEVRRVNRYLIWYTQLVRLERVSTLLEAIQVLAVKPVAELVGPHVELRDGRLSTLLDRSFPREAELCFLDRRGRLRRIGDTNAASVTALAKALGAHDGAAIRTLARRLLDGED